MSFYACLAPLIRIVFVQVFVCSDKLITTIVFIIYRSQTSNNAHIYANTLHVHCAVSILNIII